MKIIHRDKDLRDGVGGSIKVGSLNPDLSTHEHFSFLDARGYWTSKLSSL